VLLALAPLFGVLGAGSALAAGDATTVELGVHQFGHLAAPEAIVAVAGPDEVGFEDPGEGSANGPWSFDVGADGSVWLLDQVNNRLLTWSAGQPDQASRIVALPGEEVRAAADIALAPDGTIYLSYLPQAPNPRKTLQVCALTPEGALLWTRDTDIEYLNSVVRTGPDGTVYWAPGFGTNDWTPLTTPTGEPLSLEEQRAGVRPDQPVSDGLNLTYEEASEQLVRVTLTDEHGAAVESWEVASDTSLGGILATSGLLGEDPILTLGVFDQTPDDFRWESLTLRITPDGGIPVRFALDPDAVWGDVPITGLRVGPDGSFYQLRSDIDTGVTIARYPLGATQTSAPPPFSPSPPGSPSSSSPPPTTSSASPPSSTPPSTPGSPNGSVSPGTATDPSSPPIPSAPSGTSSTGLFAGLTLIGLAGVGLGGWWLVRRQGAVQATHVASSESIGDDVPESGEAGTPPDGG
jgi:hypothetical protein